MTPQPSTHHQPVYFFPSSDSNSSPSGSGGSSSGDAVHARRGSIGSDKESRPKTATSTSTPTPTTNQNAPLAMAMVSPLTPLTPGGGSCYFDASHSRQHRSHHHPHQQRQHNQTPAATHAHPRSFAHLLLGSSGGDGHQQQQQQQRNFSRASSITSLGSGSESEDEQEEEEGGDGYSEEENAAETYVTDEYFPSLAVEWETQAESGITGKDSSGLHRPTQASSASARSRASCLPTGTASSSRVITGPPRLSDLFDTTTSAWPQARTSTGPYADAIIDNPADPPPLAVAAPARKRQRRRYCAEPNCCGNALSHPGKRASPSTGQEGEEARVRELFWKRQLWLMEHRGADGMSRCGSEERQSSEQDAEQAQGLEVAASHDQVLRTAGAGLPLARVKRVMKSADDEIKMISHEAPSLLSRLCTVLIADLSVRAGRYALTRGRRTISPRDLMEVTVGEGQGSGAEWEFLRDVVEQQGEQRE